MSAPELWNAAQVAKRLGCSARHVYTVAKTGELRSIDIRATGGRPSMRWSPYDVAAFIKRRGAATEALSALETLDAARCRNCENDFSVREVKSADFYEHSETSGGEWTVHLRCAECGDDYAEEIESAGGSFARKEK